MLRKLRNQQTFGIGVALVGLIALGSCTITPEGIGGFRVEPSWWEPQDIGGYWGETQINGNCYLSNGTWCIPCGGGVRVRCSDIIIQNPQKPRDDALIGAVAQLAHHEIELEDFLLVLDDLADLDLEQEFFNLTGGLSGPEFLVENGWHDLQPGDTLENIPAMLNYFTNDNGHDVVDQLFLWSTAWKQPAEADGVEIQVYLNGDLGDDDPMDLQLIRVRGTQAGVAEALAPLPAEGSEVVMTLEGGQTFTF